MRIMQTDLKREFPVIRWMGGFTLVMDIGHVQYNEGETFPVLRRQNLFKRMGQ